MFREWAAPYGMGLKGMEPKQIWEWLTRCPKFRWSQSIPSWLLISPLLSSVQCLNVNFSWVPATPFSHRVHLYSNVEKCDSYSDYQVYLTATFTALAGHEWETTLEMAAFVWWMRFGGISKSWNSWALQVGSNGTWLQSTVKNKTKQQQ